jgi:hypothetical protein
VGVDGIGPQMIEVVGVLVAGSFDFRLLQQYRHETDMPITLRDVRFQGQSGKHMLASSFSGFGPTADLRLAGIRRTGFTNFVPLIEAYLLSAA